MLLAVESSLLFPGLLELRELRGGFGLALQKGWTLLSPPSSRLAGGLSQWLLRGDFSTKLEQGLPEVFPGQWWSRD